MCGGGERGRTYTYRYTVNTAMTSALKFTETIRLIRDGGEGGKGVWRWRQEVDIYLSLHCHHQNDSCIKMGSKGRHFNVSLIVRNKVTNKSVHRPQLLKKKDSRSGFEPRSLCLPA